MVEISLKQRSKFNNFIKSLGEFFGKPLEALERKEEAHPSFHFFYESIPFLISLQKLDLGGGQEFIQIQADFGEIPTSSPTKEKALTTILEMNFELAQTGQALFALFKDHLIYMLRLPFEGMQAFIVRGVLDLVVQQAQEWRDLVASQEREIQQHPLTADSFYHHDVRMMI